MTFGGNPELSSEDGDGSLSTHSPNYSSAVPVKWSPIIPNISSNGNINDVNKSHVAVDVGNNYSKIDPLGIFPKRSETEKYGSHGGEHVREKYPQLFLASHLAQLKNNEKYSNEIREHHSNSVYPTKVSINEATFIVLWRIILF